MSSTMMLKSSTRIPSSSLAWTSILKPRSPLEIRWVPSTSFSMGLMRPLAMFNANQTAEKITSRVTEVSRMR
ncbi:MAG: hypothetical protein BWX71_02502 [Deltaproteobacteria bacterium ADurb.Bin072]|nr:MAG: hypothetical protein BWX71_02502 [Deltaproteobacteria bacterium ADurb.Bin072]